MNTERIEIETILEQNLSVAFNEASRREQLYAIRPVFSAYRDERADLWSGSFVHPGVSPAEKRPREFSYQPQLLKQL